MDAIFKRVCKNKPVPKVAVVYATGYAEDMQVCRFIADFLTRRGAIARLGSPANLKISKGRLTLFGENIDLVYRFFPIEWMDELPNLRRLVSAYAAGNFELINGFGQVFAQSKKVSAFWREHPELLTAGERKLVSAHIPRTELFSRSRAKFYAANRDALVLKHQFGRMGEEVAIGRFYTDAEWAAEVAEVAKVPFDWTVQEFFDVAPVEIEGRMFFPCYGLYVVDGKPVDVYCRVSPFRQTCYDALNVGAYVA
jgi:hypothetical protein